jgi:hypothetical protein
MVNAGEHQLSATGDAEVGNVDDPAVRHIALDLKRARSGEIEP